MTLVIDASIAMRWLAQGQENDPVDALFDKAIGNGGDTLLIAPALILLEVHNALAKLWNRQRVTFPQFAEAQLHLGAAIQIEAVDQDLSMEAAALSMTPEVALGRKIKDQTLPYNIYDCIYVALALKWSAELVTADQKQADVAMALGCSAQLI